MQSNEIEWIRKFSIIALEPRSRDVHGGATAAAIVIAVWLAVGFSK